MGPSADGPGEACGPGGRKGTLSRACCASVGICLDVALRYLRLELELQSVEDPKSSRPERTSSASSPTLSSCNWWGGGIPSTDSQILWLNPHLVTRTGGVDGVTGVRTATQTSTPLPAGSHYARATTDSVPRLVRLSQSWSRPRGNATANARCSRLRRFTLRISGAPCKALPAAFTLVSTATSSKRPTALFVPFRLLLPWSSGFTLKR
uniref:Uncharacterized protein n=1 Tax=Rangifer tarandus platyrhynchus TaxID=3082113 RepID=A0ACB0EMU2_RANTA|nr:unnamed protein product [Rangifer tarandus platyrhynchus]